MGVKERRARSMEALRESRLAELKTFHSVWALNEEERADLQNLRHKHRKTLMKAERTERREEVRDEDEMKRLEAAMMENCDLHAKMRLRPKKARTPLFYLTRDIVRKHLAEEEQESELEAQLRAQKRKKRAERRFTRERGRKAKEDDDTFEEMTETLSSGREGELLLERERLQGHLKAVRQRMREREKSERQLQKEHERQRKREKESFWERQKEIEQKFQERQRKMNMEFVEREQEWKKEREVMKKREEQHKRRQKEMENRLNKMQKRIEGLRKEEEKCKERKKKGLRKTVRGWTDRFMNAVRSFRAA